MVHLGLEAEHSRLDVSRHPFSGGVPDDVRITTRYSEDDATGALMGVLHETGHALYERGLPLAWRDQPVGGAHGMSLHESQSLLIEMQVSRGRPFLAFLAPRLRVWLGGAGSAWEVDNLHQLDARVARGLIRVDADELTYPAHVMVRYDLERRLLGGALDPADLPEAWAVAMREHLDIVPTDDRDGCMQDIHWYAGEFGYFPTYTLGAIAAAQLFAAATVQVPDISAGIARGEFGPLVAWLRDNVHRLGSRFERDELLCRATGQPLEVTAFEEHLRARYLDNVSD
jgi:carboxypeptidase Taq